MSQKSIVVLKETIDFLAGVLFCSIGTYIIFNFICK